MNLKHTLFGIICLLFLFIGFNAHSQSSERFTEENLRESLQDILNQQGIPENDSIVSNFANLFSELPGSQKGSMLNALNFISRKSILNKIIDNQTFTNSKGKTDEFKKSILYILLETPIYYKDHSRNSLSQWLMAADDLTREEGTTLTDFNNFAERSYFFSKGYLRNSNLVDWLIGNANFTINYDETNKKPIFSIPKANLTCVYGSTDTLIIHNTSIKYNPLSDSIFNKSGTIKWEDRYGEEYSDSYVQLGDYAVNLSLSTFTTENAHYYNRNVLKGSTEGTLEDGVSLWARKTRRRPKFESYKKNVELISDKKNFRFFGGLKIEGEKLQIAGSPLHPAELHYYRNGQLFFKSQSQLMEFFRADDAEITIYTGASDSIYHPACSYEINEKGFLVSRIPEGKGENFFQISDIKMETNMRSLRWIAKSDEIEFFYTDLSFLSLNTDSFVFDRAFERELMKPEKTIFRSTNYFNPKEFERLKMYGTRNPLFDIRNLCTQNNSRTFTLSEYAGYVKSSSSELKKQLIELSYKGYLDFDQATETAVASQKLFDHLDYFTNKKDYDELEVVSPVRKNRENVDEWKQIFAAYNLKNKTLQIDSVESVILSKQQRTAFRMDSTSLTVEKNRDMKFSGRFQAGLVQFVNGQYSFNYDDFTVKIDTAEQMVFSELRTDEGGQFYAMPVTNSVYDISGTVYIDSSENKSGVFIKTGREFPRFTADEKGYVYYNEKGLADFDPANFYFEVYPYTKRDLNYITTGNFFLSGRMRTGDMLPVFQDSLQLLYDEYEVTDKSTNKPMKVNLASMGIIHAMESDSVPLYGKGALRKNAEGKSVIRLSRASFKGEGRIDWLTSQMQADEFNFFSDNISARAANFSVSENRDDERYPVLSAEDVEVSWDAENEKIICSTDTTSGQTMDIFEGRVKMAGTTVYTPEYLMGKGIAYYENSELNSDSILFRENAFHSPKGNFKSYDPDSESKKLLFSNEHMRSYTDMNVGKTVFEKTDSLSLTNIESNQYYSYPNYMLWDHEEQNAEINQSLNRHSNSAISTEETLLDSAYIVSVANFSPGTFYGGTDSLKMEYKKDGLTFYGTNADYDAKRKQITIQEVKRIMVADISVIPSSEIVIEADGKFGELKKTRIEVLNDSNYVAHEITDVDITIINKSKYTASSGTYKYRDITGTDQNVFFSKIYYDDTKGASLASGTVDEERGFTLNPYFKFKGGIEFNAKSNFLTFSGYAKMQNFCEYEGDWFFFNNEINPRNVTINLRDDLQSDSSRMQANIYADIKFLQDSTYLTTAFLKTAPGTRDNSIFSGRKEAYSVQYEIPHNRYIVAPTKSLTDTLPLDNYILYDTKNCLFRTLGELNYANINHSTIKASGNSSFDMRSQRYRMETFTIWDFYFSDEANKILAETIKMQFPSNPADVGEKFQESLVLTVGNSVAAQYQANQATDKSLPEPLNSQFVFSELNFYWNNDEGAFKSTGAVSIMAINGTQVFQKVDAKIKITSGFKSDEIRAYLQVGEEWFYFRLFETNLYAFSSIPEFNKIIEEEKISKRRDPNSRLRYLLANDTEARSFADNF